jgi:hypothetical protein
MHCWYSGGFVSNFVDKFNMSAQYWLHLPVLCGNIFPTSATGDRKLILVIHCLHLPPEMIFHGSKTTIRLFNAHADGELLLKGGYLRSPFSRSISPLTPQFLLVSFF